MIKQLFPMAKPGGEQVIDMDGIKPARFHYGQVSVTVGHMGDKAETARTITVRIWQQSKGARFLRKALG